MIKEGLGSESKASCQILSTRVTVDCGEESLYPFLARVNPIFGWIVGWFSSNPSPFMSGIPAIKESFMTEMLAIKEGGYMLESEVVAIVDDNIEDTSSNSNRVMVDVGSDSSDGEKESVT